MTVKAILSRKGDDVVTIEPTATLCDAVKILDLHHIGAVVITEADQHILGILSERDIVRTLAHNARTAGGCRLCDEPVELVMTREVATSKQSDTVYNIYYSLGHDFCRGPAHQFIVMGYNLTGGECEGAKEVELADNSN